MENEYLNETYDNQMPPSENSFNDRSLDYDPIINEDLNYVRTDFLSEVQYESETESALGDEDWSAPLYSDNLVDDSYGYEIINLSGNANKNESSIQNLEHDDTYPNTKSNNTIKNRTEELNTKSTNLKAKKGKLVFQNLKRRLELIGFERPRELGWNDVIIGNFIEGSKFIGRVPGLILLGVSRGIQGWIISDKDHPLNGRYTQRHQQEYLNQLKNFDRYIVEDLLGHSFLQPDYKYLDELNRQSPFKNSIGSLIRGVPKTGMAAIAIASPYPKSALAIYLGTTYAREYEELMNKFPEEESGLFAGLALISSLANLSIKKGTNKLLNRFIKNETLIPKYVGWALKFASKKVVDGVQAYPRWLIQEVGNNPNVIKDLDILTQKVLEAAGSKELRDQALVNARIGIFGSGVVSGHSNTLTKHNLHSYGSLYRIVDAIHLTAKSSSYSYKLPRTYDMKAQEILRQYGVPKNIRIKAETVLKLTISAIQEGRVNLIDIAKKFKYADIDLSKYEKALQDNTHLDIETAKSRHLIEIHPIFKLHFTKKTSKSNVTLLNAANLKSHDESIRKKPLTPKPVTRVLTQQLRKGLIAQGAEPQSINHTEMLGIIMARYWPGESDHSSSEWLKYLLNSKKHN